MKKTSVGFMVLTLGLGIAYAAQTCPASLTVTVDADGDVVSYAGVMAHFSADPVAPLTELKANQPTALPLYTASFFPRVMPGPEALECRYVVRQGSTIVNWVNMITDIGVKASIIDPTTNANYPYWQSERNGDIYVAAESPASKAQFTLK